jgi:NADH-quinone oxidoreductase subunit L
MNLVPWLVWLVPLAAAAWVTLAALRRPKLSAAVSIGAVVLSFILSLVTFGLHRSAGQPVEWSVRWLTVGGLEVPVGVRLDSLSLLMLLVVSGVGSVIHIYSWGYMRADRSIGRYFAGLSFFTFAMLGIVLATNFVQLFVCWELVGLSSYLLIGFWYDRPAAAAAAQKAFITTRLGDFGFLLGIIWVWFNWGTVHFGQLQQTLQHNPALRDGAALALAGVLILCGAVGKSAQFPLHVWLPDAMEGPTPVSALIHAATMVAAGVYLLCRVHFMLVEPVLQCIGWLGAGTAVLAAVIALQQNDIKRILAYSTLSQLGYMIMAVGLGGPGPAMFHLTTHAFFKALLFLGAGAVIVALHHQQDIWQMGGLKARMPTTYWTFLVASLALCGVPPLSGFYSKDQILALAAARAPLWFGLGVGVAILTTLYMFRLVFVVFLGPSRSEPARQATEAPAVMKWPLVALAVPAAVSGLWGIEAFLQPQFTGSQTGLEPVGLRALVEPLRHAPGVAFAGLGAFIVGLLLARTLYYQAATDPLPTKLGALATAMNNRFYFDELYQKLIALTHEALARLIDWSDRWVIAGLAVRGLHGTTELAGRLLRLAQTGNAQTYALLVVFGVIAVLAWVLSG